MATSFTPAGFSYELGTSAALTGATDTWAATQYAIASCVFPRCRLYNSAGTLINYPEGLAVVLFADTSEGTGDFLINSWNLATNAKDDYTSLKPGFRTIGGIAPLITGQTLANTDDACSIYGGVAPISQSNPTLAFWTASKTGASPKLVILRNGRYTSGGTLVYGTTVDEPADDIAALTSAGLITSVVPIYSSNVQFLVSKYTPTTGVQLYLVKQIQDDKLDPTATNNTYVTAISKEYTTADDALWSNRPDTVLDVQQLPYNPDYLVALMGTWASPTIHKAITRPRLVTLYGPYVASDKGLNSTTRPLSRVESHADQANVIAHGMCLGNNGDVYVVGTGDILGSTHGKLICKYSASQMGTLLASVEHESDGLGDGYANPEDTHIVTPMWDGSRLIVQDHDASKTRFFVYDKDLTYLAKYEISTAASSYLRFRGGRFNTPWFINTLAGT